MRREIHYRHFYRTGRLLSNRKPCRFRLWPEDSAFGEDSALAGFRLEAGTTNLDPYAPVRGRLWVSSSVGKKRDGVRDS